MVNSALNSELNVEERQTAQKIKEQLADGKLLYKGNEIEGDIKEYTITEKTEAGEEYLSLTIRAVKPQEGGYYL